MRNRLEEGAQQLSLTLSDHHYTSLIQFLRVLNKWNRVYNLTAVRNINDMVGRHILDSLSVFEYLPKENVLDVGTGAGLPVLPLAIVRPDLKFLSVESNGKKTRFQQQAIQELGLSNVRVSNVRIEDCEDSAHTLISRAFTAPGQFLDSIKKNTLDSSRVVIMLGTKEKMPDTLPQSFVLSTLTQVDVPQFDSVRHIAVCHRT
ncbi:UNVERIFIED_CONTAM: hypothetical protein GTU68_008683 [Idotea baltica]|nr:hypothetical protein [Idotea baltica]